MSSFQKLLSSVLSEVPESAGALFLDETGETVAVVAEGPSGSDLKILGAYLAIALRRTRHLHAERGLGAPRSIQIEHPGLVVQVRMLPDGYYLVLLHRRPGQVGRARRSLERAAELLTREITGP